MVSLRENIEIALLWKKLTIAKVLSNAISWSFNCSIFWQIHSRSQKSTSSNWSRFWSSLFWVFFFCNFGSIGLNMVNFGAVWVEIISSVSCIPLGNWIPPAGKWKRESGDNFSQFFSETGCFELKPQGNYFCPVPILASFFSSLSDIHSSPSWLFQTKAEAYLAVNKAPFHRAEISSLLFLVASSVVVDLL